MGQGLGVQGPEGVNGSERGWVQEGIQEMLGVQGSMKGAWRGWVVRVSGGFGVWEGDLGFGRGQGGGLV